LVAEEYSAAHGENPLLDLASYQDLQTRALAGKIQLSSRPHTAIVHHHNGKSVKVELTREDFEERSRHLIEKCKTICEIVMQEAKMKWDNTDITSHTLGVVLWDETHLEEYVFPMIRKRTAIPASAKNSFGIASANMQRAVVKVVEGESTLPGECTPLGLCDVQLPPFLPKGSPVELTYHYNANQVLEVNVEACGNRSKVSIERNTGLAPEEMEKAISSLGKVTVE